MNDDLINLEYNLILRDIKNYLKTLEDYGVKNLDIVEDKKVFRKTSNSVGSLNEDITHCSSCDMAGNAAKIIFEKLPKDIKVLFLVDSPKMPDVGRVFSLDERNLFSRILKAMELNVDEIFVLPIVRCRLMPHELDKFKPLYKTSECSIFLERSINLIKPRSICFLGNELKEFIGESKFSNNLFLNRYRYFSTYSINDLIIDMTLKKESWSVFLDVMKFLND